MIFVLGGSFQGKSDWVKSKYSLENNSYHSTTLQDIDINLLTHNIIIISELENHIKESLDIEKYKQLIYDLDVWEKDNLNRKVIFIGNQIGNDVVPIEKESRIWRDNVGFFYQILVGSCSEVYRIWAGLPEKIKG